MFYCNFIKFIEFYCTDFAGFPLLSHSREKIGNCLILRDFCGSGGLNSSNKSRRSNKLICNFRRISKRDSSRRLMYFKNAKSKYAHKAIQSWVCTALIDVPTKLFTFRCCFIHLKKSSTCQRSLYSLVITSDGKWCALVKKEYSLPLYLYIKRNKQKVSSMSLNFIFLS